MSQTLRVYYKEKVIPLLLEQFKYKNIHEVPKIIKITVNRGLGEASKNNKALDISVQELRLYYFLSLRYKCTRTCIYYRPTTSNH